MKHAPKKRKAQGDKGLRSRKPAKRPKSGPKKGREKRKSRRKDVSYSRARTQAEVARAFGVQPRTVRNWVEAGMPRRADGTYDIVAIATWRVENRARREDARAPEGEHSRDWYETEYRKVKTEHEQLKLDVALGKLLLREEVDKGRVARVLAVKRALLRLPKAVAQPLADLAEPRLIEAYLRDRVREIVAQFAGQETSKP